MPHDAVPLHIYKRRELFAEAMREYVARALNHGRYGWRVTDCVVTMTECLYAVWDGPPSRRGSTSSTDFRKLTPRVVVQALEQAATVVCEPVVRARLEVPVVTVGAVVAAVSRLDARIETPSLLNDLAVLETVLPVLRAQELQRLLPGLTSGEGVLESSFAGYRPVAGEPPVRRVPV